MPSFTSPGADDDDGAHLSREGLRRHNRLLYEIISQRGRDREAQVQRALARTTDLLGLDQGILARVEEDTYTVEQCYSPGGGLEEGHVFDLGDVYCALTLEKDGLLAIDHVAESPFREERCYDVLALESYVGVPVRVGGALYGTLAFSGAAPKAPPSTEADRSLVRLLGQWAGSVLERRAADRALQQSEERFRLLAEHVSDVVCLHDLEGRLVYASPSVRRVLGYAPEDFVGHSPLDFAHPDDHARIIGATERALHGEPDVTVRVRLRHAEGAWRWCETAGHPVYADDGGETVEHFLTSTRDVTARVRAQAERERANTELRRRNRELEDFAHIASHDLQEPLRKVRAFAELMREDYAEKVDETGQYYLERMEDGAERMSRLVSDLLGLSRVTTQGHPFEPVDLEKIAAAVCTDLEMRVEETQGRVDVGALPRLDADPTQMRQLLQNLIGNALKFHRKGVPPRVEVRGAREPASAHGEAGSETRGENSVAPGAGGELVRLVVEDNGIGFEKKFLDRIFTPLQRLNQRDAFEGTGIGLAVCRRIAERHGGAIRAESTPGAGSRFTVLFPAQQAESGADEAKTAENEASALRDA